LVVFLFFGRRKPMFRTALIILFLALAACVSEHAQNPPPPAQAGKNLNVLQAQQLDAIICAIPSAPHGWIPVPAGKKPTEFCPEAAITYRLYHNQPGAASHLPWTPGGSPPPVQDETADETAGDQP
jgi:hypothetical protein